MASKTATPAEIRAARAFLRQRSIPSRDVPPRKFANTAKELSMGFAELLKWIARLYSGGQNQGTWRREAILAEARK